MSTEIEYQSSELELFKHANNWKRYFSSFLIPYISGDVAEVGAGIGATTPFLITDSITSYECIEPDFDQANHIQSLIDSNVLPSYCSVCKGVLNEDINKKYDAVTYIDVIEHIENDKAELVKAMNSLKNGGYLCIVVPANPKDFSPFDKQIGHFRRYNKKMLIDALPLGFNLVTVKHLDICGSLSSKVNKFILKQSYPKKSQILFWDRFLVPISRILDKLTFFYWGKSLLLVAQKTA
jgi:hypothetical protein